MNAQDLNDAIKEVWLPAVKKELNSPNILWLAPDKSIRGRIRWAMYRLSNYPGRLRCRIIRRLGGDPWPKDSYYRGFDEGWDEGYRDCQDQA